MKGLEPNTPIIIGVGFCQEKTEDPIESSEPYQLMVNAVLDAADDATSLTVGREVLLEQIESISIPQGSWQYRNPGKLVADALGCPSAKSILADLGVLHLALLSDLCEAISAGEQHMGVITGGEARYRELRSKITQQPVANIQQPEDTPPADLHHTSSDPFCSRLEEQSGLFQPVQFFSIIESALRCHEGLSIEEHRDKIANLYSSFSDIAAENPHAWRQESVPAEEIRNATEKNSMLAFPYTKRHASQWNVNQAVAIMVCSAAKAEELGLDSDAWIYPVSAAHSKHVVPLAQQRKIYSHPGTILSGKRALALAGISSSKELMAAELYSCFPSAVRSFALDLQLEGVCPFTVTGAMPFAGGPLNHFSIDGVARMVEVLRSAGGIEAEKRTGLVANLSGIFGKHACALFSNKPNDKGYGFEDITDMVAEQDLPLPLNGDYVGPVTVVGYTVAFDKEEPAHGFAFCDTPNGERTVVNTGDRELLTLMMQEEFCGRQIKVLHGRSFSIEE
jgi:acetyl-CoA C-acetyltransferase